MMDHIGAGPSNRGRQMEGDDGGGKLAGEGKRKDGGVNNITERLLMERMGVRGEHRKMFLQNRWSQASKHFSYDLVSHYGCVNAVEFSYDGAWIVSGGDDRRVLLWNVEESLEGRGFARCMAAEHRSNIFCLDTDQGLTKIYSGGNDEQVIVHDSVTGELVDCFQHEEPVFGLSVHPVQPQLFLTACSDGRLLMYDMRQPVSSEAVMITGSSYAFHSVQFNPVEPRLLVGANKKFGIGLYDIRKPRSTVLRYLSRSSMYARFNSSGTQIVGLRRRLPPVLFNIQDPVHVCEFDNPQYYNSCTMKSCCFGGPGEQYVFSGSDDFNLYVWKIPEDKETTWVDRAHVILKGHRSIVNQVRFNPQRQLLASSGVEKIIKIWSDWPFLPELEDQTSSQSKARKVYTHEDYIGLVLRSDAVLHFDTLAKSTNENPRMMAFFDSLVQREIEGWDSDDDIENASSGSSSSETQEDGDEEDEEAEGVTGFSHRSIGRRSRRLMERISVSLADDVMREERAIAEAQNTVGDEILNSSNDSGTSNESVPEEANSGGQNNSGSQDNLSSQDNSGGQNISGSQRNGQDQTPSTSRQTQDQSVNNTPAPETSNRIAELISQKRSTLMKIAKKRGKRMREKSDSEISKSIDHARKVLRISEPEIRFPSSDESCDETGGGWRQSRDSSSVSQSPDFRARADSDSSSADSRVRGDSDSSDSTPSSPPLPERVCGSQPISSSPRSSTPVPSPPSSSSPRRAASPSCSPFKAAARSSGAPVATRVSVDKQEESEGSGIKIGGGGQVEEQDAEEDKIIDITALLPSSSTSTNNNAKIKELRKKRLKILTEDESEDENHRLRIDDGEANGGGN